jgi:iron(III) transport system permease protein
MNGAALNRAVTTGDALPEAGRLGATPGAQSPGAPLLRPRWPLRATTGRSYPIQKLLLVFIVVWMLILIGLPLVEVIIRSMHDKQGEFVGLANFAQYLTTPALARSISNSLIVSIAATAIALMLAFPYAYALTRSAIKGKTVLRYLAMAPLFAPTMMHGIGLIYLFGRQGMVTNGFFGVLPGVDIHLYGAMGIIIAEVVYVFPQIVLLLMVSLSVADYRLYEAATSLGAGSFRRLLTVTLPSIKYGLVSAVFVAFTLSFTDFGAPKVVGGDFNVLAVDIFKQVVGQQNLAMGAAISILLLLPAVVAFVIDQVMRRRQQSVLASGAMPYRIVPDRRRDAPLLAFCILVCAAILALMATVFFAALVTRWPYDLSLTLKHFTFTNVAGYGLEPLWNSIIVAAGTAVVGTALSFGCAYAVEKFRVWPPIRRATYLASTVPLAIPGMVIGLAYIFFFNRPEFSLPFTDVSFPNPLNALYGTVFILILANIVHFYSVPFITATAALKQLDKEYELVGESLSVGRWRTFGAITVPLSLGAILENAMYLFVNAMTTISAVVFLYSPDWKLASVSIVSMDDAGDVAAAAAMSALIVLVNIAARGLYEFATRAVRRRGQRWQLQEVAS